MDRQPSALEQARRAYRPQLPQVLAKGVESLAFAEGEPTSAVRDAEVIRERFPHSIGRPMLSLAEGTGPVREGPLEVGVVLSGGQAPGGHNVIAGLFDGLSRIHAGSKLFGFRGGPRGILEAEYEVLDAERIEPYRNSGGFDLIGSGRDKIETAEQLAACRATCEKMGLHGLIIIGGDDSNTNAAVLAEYFLEHGVATAVNGVPKTIDGDLRGEYVEASFGFDTATRVYSELIGNICRDAKSAGKYWHFIKLMGRSASHVTLECALQTHANIALIGEEVEELGFTLRQVVDHVVKVVRRRAEAGLNHGVCLVPEGLVEFVPEIRELIAELNSIMHDNAKYFETIPTFMEKQEFVNKKLSRDSSYVFSGLPVQIQAQLLLERDSHGNVQVSRIDTEQLLLELVEDRIKELQAKDEFPGKFQVQHHFMGYEGRCSYPTNFDADYTYALGQVAALLTAFGRTGYISSLTNLAAPSEAWRPLGVPLTSMMQMETRKGRLTPVIAKALVRTNGPAFLHFAERRPRWQQEDRYVYPGPIQFFGPGELSDARNQSLMLDAGASR